jgi:uncharacterized membrane protein YccF (DUF307 family)
MNLIGNLIWLIFGGLFAAIGYLLGGLVLCLTIVGIPFGFQCFKIAGMVLSPFGKKVVTTDSASGCFALFANVIWILSGAWITAINHLFWGLVLAITIIGLPFAKQHFKLIELSLMPFGKRIM